MSLLAQITPGTQVAVPLSLLITVSVTIGGALISIGVAVVKGAWFLRGILEEIRQLKSSVQSSWTRHEHERWAHRLERENAEIGLRVPPVETESTH